MVARFEVFLVELDPTRGSEIRKTRPCAVVSPDDINPYLRTVTIAPMTSKEKQHYPYRVQTTFKGTKGQVVLDQIRTVDKSRLVKKLGKLSESTARNISDTLVDMFTY
jgi:mRNA interferase MazF